MTRATTTALLIAVCCTAALRAFAGELPAVPLFRFGIVANSVGAANLVPADITGDGRPEIISCSSGSPFALEHRAGGYEQIWYGGAVECSGVAAGDADGDGATDVIVVGAAKLLVFDPRGLGVARAQVALPAGPGGGFGSGDFDVAFGNVDLDAAPEIVVAGSSATYVYDAATLELQWTAQGYGGSTVVIGDVDGDARNEIVVGGGSILDGGNEVLKWGYVGGFPYLAVGNVDADAKAEIVFANYWSSSVTVLHGDTMNTSTLTGFPTIEQLAVADADGDGTNEVIAGNNQWGAIVARRASDNAALWDIPNPEHGCMGIAVADVDGDGVREVLWGAGWTSSGKDALFVGNPLTETIEWLSDDLDGSFSVAAGDLDGDGRTEIAILTYSSNSGYDGPILTIFDAKTGVATRSIDVEYRDATGIAIAQLDGDAAMEIAVEHSSMISVYDGVTGASEWIGPCCSTGMFVTNVDQDPTAEIITYFDGKIVIMHGISNIIQSSRVFSNAARAVGDVTGDGVPEVIAATQNTLYVLTNTLATQAETPFNSTTYAAVTASEGGRIAVLTPSYPPTQLVVFDKTLTQQWSCYVNNNATFTSVAVGTIAGQTRVLLTESSGLLRAMPISGNTCPAGDSRFLGGNYPTVTTADVNGDSHPELLAGTMHMGEISLIGLPDEMRGDVNRDSVIDSNDIDGLVDYVFGVSTPMATTGDANADERLSGEDAFALIHAEYGGGSLPD